MESSSFYITLPSNASMDFYPNNTASNYIIHMPRTFYLQGKYEVALAEIQYPHTWKTMTDKDEFYMMIRPNDDAEDITPVSIPIGYYKSVEDLVHEINDCILEALNHTSVSLKYHKATRKVYLKTNGYDITFSTPLSQMLGFSTNKHSYLWYDKQTVAEQQADLSRGFYTLYVYCSLCEAQVVGDYYVPLIRTVAIEGRDGDLIMKTYNNPHYVPVNTSKFDTIEINIKDDQGKNVAFESGKVLCKLHFRQRAI